MWERLGASSELVIGAAILFVIFCALLFIFERKDEKNGFRKKYRRPIEARPPGYVLKR
ncbi:MAG: hypothetical protein ACOX8Q_03840 [Christensenellales bacterium]|jgi:hypothetical protein